MLKKIEVDPEKCTGCRLCELACSYKHGERNPKKSRIRVVQWMRQGIDVPIVCIQCYNPPCIAACPVEAIYQDPESGVLINNEKCNSCMLCAVACVNGSIAMGSNRKAIKCDLCGGEPECVKVCETCALKYVEAPVEGVDYYEKRAIEIYKKKGISNFRKKKQRGKI